MEIKRLRKFLIITFVVTGLAWSSLAILTKLSLISFTHPIGTILHIIGGFGPTIASLFVMEEKLSFKSAVKFIFHYKRKTIIYFWMLAAMAIAVIGISSMEFNSALPWYLIPVVFLQAVFIYGGEEELGGAWHHATYIGKTASVSSRNCNYRYSMGNLAYSTLVCRRFLSAKHGISILLGVRCVIEFLFGCILKKDTKCICLQCFSWIDKHVAINVCNQIESYFGMRLDGHVSVFHIFVVLRR